MLISKDSRPYLYASSTSPLLREQHGGRRCLVAREPAHLGSQQTERNTTAVLEQVQPNMSARAQSHSARKATRMKQRTHTLDSVAAPAAAASQLAAYIVHKNRKRM